MAPRQTSRKDTSHARDYRIRQQTVELSSEVRYTPMPPRLRARCEARMLAHMTQEPKES